jgi:hypothetical protein
MVTYFVGRVERKIDRRRLPVAPAGDSREKGPMHRSLVNLAWVLVPWLGAGCATHGAPGAAAPTAESSDTEPGQAAPSAPGAPGQASRPGTASAAFPPAPLPGGEEPTPEKALPELRVEPLGMHVGGGSNSPEEKAPFHRALERQFPAFLECYRLAQDPWSGGSFGIDIKIGRAGGSPSVEQPRTKIRGAGFQECMVAAIGKTQFEKPKAGPTVISYSVRFTLGTGKK